MDQELSQHKTFLETYFHLKKNNYEKSYPIVDDKNVYPVLPT